MALENIHIHGARENNLKNINVDFPQQKLIIVTGLSGSGKSSLAMDVLFAEGQRRYAESLSSYARQFLMRAKKPDVDYITGIAPAIAINQKVVNRTPRSTVGSITEIYDYLRILFARIGKIYSPISGKEVIRQDTDFVLNFILQFSLNCKIYILFPFPNTKDQKEFTKHCQILLQKGFTRLWIKNEVINIEDIDKKSIDTQKIFVLVDRLIIQDKEDEDTLHRLTDSLNTAFFEGHNEITLQINDKIYSFINRLQTDGINFEPPSPNLFSYNNSLGSCPTCEGLGYSLGIDENLVIPNKNISIYDGAIAPWKGEIMGWWKEQFITNARKFNFPIHKPIIDLTEEQYKTLWSGNEYAQGIDDFFENVQRHLYKMHYRVLYARYRGKTICPTCKGSRLRKESLYIQIKGKNIYELSTMPIDALWQWQKAQSWNTHEKNIAKRLFLEIEQRLKTIIDVGMPYLTLNRPANTLSGGESQRLQLAKFLGSNLTQSLYILDEPSIGLHPRDTHHLIKILKKLRDLGNTVIVVEHDEQIIKEADYIIDMGPLAGKQGGEVIFAGTPKDLSQTKTLTSDYLTNKKTIATNKYHLPSYTEFIKIEGATHNNLKKINISFPLNAMTVVCGVSGSGKSSLVKNILYPALLKTKKLAIPITDSIGQYNTLIGNLDGVQHIEWIDQNTIGRTSRSNPISYMKAYDDIRELFSNQYQSKLMGFLPKHFSFNVEGGRCENCKGEGEEIVEMQFLADVRLECEVCHGKRFKPEVLEVTYNKKNIYEVLNMTVDEAVDFFKNEKHFIHKINALQKVGLGYVALGQSLSTMSGGELQRIKLATFLIDKDDHQHTIFIFDEPTTGLHFDDVNKLYNAFSQLIEKGNTIIVVEHHLDLIRHADWIIELGPESGEKGGYLVYCGNQKEYLKQNTPTTKFL